MNQRRWFQAAFAAFVALVAGYFHQGFNGNANSRLLTVYALVENGTLQADPWADSTIDRAVIRGHVYSDKAPLSSFIVVPFYALWRIPGGQQSEADRVAGLHLGVAVAAVVPFTCYGLLLLRQVGRRIHDQPAVVVWGVLFALAGTFVVQFAGGYFGHVLAGSLAVLQFSLLHRAGKDRSGSGRLSPWPLAWAGVVGGLSVAAEYPMLLIQAVWLVWLVSTRRGKGLPYFLMGALGPALGLLAYNHYITGSAWVPPYRFQLNFAEMRASFGIGLPDPRGLWGVTFSLYRGAFVFGPPLLILLWPWGRRDPEDRPESTVHAGPSGAWVGVQCAVQLLFMASYCYWDGGRSAGPRFLIPVIMLAVFERLPSVLASTPGQWLWIVLGFVGVVLQGMIGATEPLAPAGDLNPIRDFYWPMLTRMQWNPHTLLFELGAPRSWGTLVFRSWYILVLIGGVVFTRWLARVQRHRPVSALQTNRLFQS